MNEIASDSRRRFLKTLVLGTAASTLATGEWFGALVADVRPVGDNETGRLRLRLTDFPALKNVNGSVRIGGSSISGDFPLGLYPIIINRAANNVFYALDSRCSHADCAVRAYNATSRVCVCPCHGSRYAIDGKVVTGPASFPLISYPITFDGQDTLTIELPTYAFAMDGRIVDASESPAPRFRIDFYAQPGTDYQILFRKSQNDVWAAISFATTPTGIANKTAFAGRDADATVYVDRVEATGFYAVAVKFKTV